MRAFRKRFVSMALVASVAVLGAACAEDDTADPGVEAPADDTGTDTGTTDDLGTETPTEEGT